MSAAVHTIRRLRVVGAAVAIFLLGAAVPVAMNVVADAALDFNCSVEYQIDQVMDNGARWQMCWERRAAEGIVFHDVTYTPPGGTAVEILGRAALAQIHVPYDDNGARFHDLSDYGLGTIDDLDSQYSGPNMNDLQAGDCPDGTRLTDGGYSVLCQTEAANGYAYKYYGEQAQSTSLNLFSVSHIGAYNYVVAWNFDDDGTIRPEVGATGQLQIVNFGGPNSVGWPVGGSRVAVAHMHNFYWRLDFDLGGTRFDDRVEELEALPAAGGSERRNVRRAFTTETARRVAPQTFRSWRIRDLNIVNADNHPISVELVPNTDNIFRGPETFTQNELYVTRQRTCERFASHNVQSCAGSPNSVAGFANGEGLANQDTVVWYGTSFHHLPRDEDEDRMHPHWSGFSIIPRDLTATNPTAP